MEAECLLRLRCLHVHVEYSEPESTRDALVYISWRSSARDLSVERKRHEIYDYGRATGLLQNGTKSLNDIFSRTYNFVITHDQSHSSDSSSFSFLNVSMMRVSVGRGPLRRPILSYHSWNISMFRNNTCSIWRQTSSSCASLNEDGNEDRSPRNKVFHHRDQRERKCLGHCQRKTAG